MTAAASELWNLASGTVKDALRPGTMPDKRKRVQYKRKYETKEAMALRLADGSGRTLEECTRMTKVEIDAELIHLGLTGLMSVRLSTEEHNEGQSWEEVKAAKAAAEAEKAAT